MFNESRNQALKDHRNLSLRSKVASEICKKCKLSYNEQVSFLSIPIVEDKFDCNIYIIDLNNVPILGATIKLWDCLLYKSKNRHKQHYFLLYDEVAQHYDVITDI